MLAKNHNLESQSSLLFFYSICKHLVSEYYMFAEYHNLDSQYSLLFFNIFASIQSLRIYNMFGSEPGFLDWYYSDVLVSHFKES
ncbi:hypothetical protein KC19_N011200 [Ceratodon purpureus]|nr:hypothetical protein KC19_N011200 [Ceratodon purpureus]